MKFTPEQKIKWAIIIDASAACTDCPVPQAETQG